MSLWGDLNNYVGALSGTAGSIWGLLTNPSPENDTSVLALTGAGVTILIPGTVQTEEVNGQLVVEKVPIEDLSGTVKLVKGFEDGLLRFDVTLTTDDIPDGLAGTIGSALSGDFGAVLDALAGGDNQKPMTAVEKLTALHKVFCQYKPDGSGEVMVWQITQEIANARGVSEVLFINFLNLRRSSSDKIDVTLNFLEYLPATVLFETGEAVPPPPAQVPDPDTTNPLV